MSYKLENILEPCNINEIEFNYERAKEALDGYFSPIMMKYIKSTSTKNLKLEDGFMEFVTAECINGKRVGEGHSPMDVVKDEKGIDVFCVCLNGNETNEKSLTQNFAKTSKELEKLFKQKKSKKAIELYKKIWYTKLCEARIMYSLTDLYYLGFISTNKSIYMSLYKINVDAILNIKDLGFTKQAKSVNFKNVIDYIYGHTKLYASKKRMEVRLCRNILNCSNTKKIYDLNNSL